MRPKGTMPPIFVLIKSSLWHSKIPNQIVQRVIQIRQLIHPNTSHYI